MQLTKVSVDIRNEMLFIQFVVKFKFQTFHLRAARQLNIGNERPTVGEIDEIEHYSKEMCLFC